MALAVINSAEDVQYVRQGHGRNKAIQDAPAVLPGHVPTNICIALIVILDNTQRGRRKHAHFVLLDRCLRRDRRPVKVVYLVHTFVAIKQHAANAL